MKSCEKGPNPTQKNKKKQTNLFHGVPSWKAAVKADGGLQEKKGGGKPDSAGAACKCPGAFFLREIERAWGEESDSPRDRGEEKNKRLAVPDSAKNELSAS